MTAVVWTRREMLSTAAAVVAGLAGDIRSHAQAGQVTPTAKPMKIGIIGSGQQGGSIGLNWARAGHEVLFSSRNPDTLKDLVASAGPKARAGLPQEAATFGDVVLIAVPYGALPQVGKDYAPLMTGKDRCTLLVHPEDAGRIGLANGGLAHIRSKAGSVTAPVEVSEEMMPGVVCLPHGWGHDKPGARLSVAARHAGVCNNILAPGELVDAISGNAVVNGIPVEITAA